MFFALLIYGSEAEWKRLDQAARQRRMDGHIKAVRQETDDGTLVAGIRLQQSSTAKTVRAMTKGPIVLDGPFAETKEQLGGFQLLECESLEQAIAYAKILIEGGGTVEIRPVHDDPGAVD
jgi:hypothetical protein